MPQTKHIILIIFALTLISPMFGQTDTTQNGQVQIRVSHGDTSYHMVMKDIYLNAPTAPSTPKFKSARDERQYYRLVRNLKIVYPYAKMAKHKLDSMNQKMATLQTDKERREYAKAVEKQIEKQFTPILLDLTYSQGDLLIKLIDRETGQSPYQLVKDIRGSLRAVFYQAIARIFTHNLKDKYDKDGNDKTIEMIVQGLEDGFY